MKIEKTQSKKHLVLAGAGHAHLTVLLKLRDVTAKGHTATVISPSAYFYYSGMGPGMLSGFYKPQEIRFHIKKMVEDRGASFIEDSVISIDPAKRILLLRSGIQMQYDVVSFNIGSGIRQDNVAVSGESVFPVKPIINLLQARKRILESFKDRTAGILVVGGGPAGLEISANVWKLMQDNNISGKITFVCGERMLKGFPERARTIALKSLKERGITVIEKASLRSLEKGIASLSNGATLAFDIAFLATGVKPPAVFRDSGLETGNDDGLLVNDSLQSVSHPEIFGGGDCISLKDHPLPKVGVHAVKENTILYNNLLTMIEGGELLTYTPQKNYLLIFNLGNGRGLLWRNPFVIDGRPVFWLKNYIDRKFMRKFQVSGELDEQ
jgi:NADH dehydrogenase FAD-containing subunit